MDIPQLKSLNDNKTIVYQLQCILANEILNLFYINLNPFDIDVTRTVDAKFGDYTSNIALKITGELHKNPREIATAIAIAIQNNLNPDTMPADEERLYYGFIKNVEVAGTGFINFYLNEDYFLKILQRVLQENENYGKWEIGNQLTVLNEFGSPNAFKPLSVGHLRNAITGLSLSRIFSALGFKVVNLNYYSDIGMHVAKSIYMYLRKEIPADFENRSLYDKMNFIVSCYIEANKLFTEDDNIKKEIQDINLKIFSKTDEKINQVYNKLLNWSLEHQKEFFERVGVHFDYEYSESQISEKGVELAKQLDGNLLIRDDDALVFPGEKYGVNRYVFLSKLGTPTYSAKDMALAVQKKTDYPDFYFSTVLTSVEQSDYFKTLITALYNYDSSFKDKYFHLGYGWLLGEDGKKTSTRKGNTVNAVDYLNEAQEYSRKRIEENKKYTIEEKAHISEKIGICGIKFLFLAHEFHKDIIYSPDKFLNPEGFSGPYILYSYVRAKSILREANSEIQNIDSEYQINNDEFEVIKLISQFEQVTLRAGKNIAPHLIANYIFDLAQSFNKFYKNNKVLVDDEKTKNFRLSLTKAVSIVLANGMYLLGIDTIEQM